MRLYWGASFPPILEFKICAIEKWCPYQIRIDEKKMETQGPPQLLPHAPPNKSF